MNMGSIFMDDTSCGHCNKEQGIFSDKGFRSSNSKTKSSTHVVTRTMKTLSRRALSPVLLSTESQGSAERSLSGLRLSHMSSLLSFRWLLCWLLVVSVVVRCQGQDVAEQSRGTEAVDKYLSSFGYYSQEHGGSQNDRPSSSAGVGSEAAPGHTADDRSRAIKRLQAFFHLPVSGQLDTDTQKIMRTARCGRKDIEGGDAEADGTLLGALRPASGRRVKRYNVNRYGDGSLAKWNVTQLTWRLSSPSRQLSESKQREIITRSLAVWGEYMPITFVEDRSQKIPDIHIRFVRGEHGPRPDPIFDGRPQQALNVLAHAWGPGYDIKGLAGDVHFDEDDDWTDYDTLLGVAVHELGHSMGLGHSEDDSAIMYPVYRSVAALAQDDINGITEMYGSASGTRPRPRTQAPVVWTYKPEPRTRAPVYTLKPGWVEPPTTQLAVDMCSTVNVDAVFEDPTTVIGRKYMAVSDEYVHTLTQHGVLVKSERLQDVFPGVPMNPDVGFSISKKRTVYFIKGDLMWAYKDGNLENDRPRSLRSLQFPESPKFSITINERDGSNRLLLFGARYWWIFDVDRSSPVQYWLISSFSGQLPSGVRFAARWIDNYLYAVTQDSYVIMDLDMRRLIHERPIAGKPEWLQALCGHGSRVSASVTSLFAVVMFTSIAKSFLQW